MPCWYSVPCPQGLAQDHCLIDTTLRNENQFLVLCFDFADHKTGVKVSATLDMKAGGVEACASPAQGSSRTQAWGLPRHLCCSARSLPPASSPLRSVSQKPLALHLVPNPLIRLLVDMPSDNHAGTQATCSQSYFQLVRRRQLEKRPRALFPLPRGRLGCDSHGGLSGIGVPARAVEEESGTPPPCVGSGRQDTQQRGSALRTESDGHVLPDVSSAQQAVCWAPIGCQAVPGYLGHISKQRRVTPCLCGAANKPPALPTLWPFGGGPVLSMA